MANATYIGRFAPSPTGPLHFGSLLAAVASYLDARAQQGAWLVRMEDLDPPREPAGAAALILEQLTAYGFDWDGDVLYQSDRLPAYAAALTSLANEGLCFRCACTRADLQANAGVYPGACRARGLSARDLQYADDPKQVDAIRLRVKSSPIHFCDRIQGKVTQAIEEEVGDFIIRRKDRLFAYQLAVVVDDAFQNISDVVRGTDLLDSTPRQIYLQQSLGLPTPRYAHLPIIVDAAGDKLSKQSFAPALKGANARADLHACLKLLGQAPPASLASAAPAEILAWGVAHWQLHAVPKLATLQDLTSA